MLTQVVILVGGKGTRLGSLTANMPKPLLNVNGRPFLDSLIQNFARFGLKKFILLAGHCGDVIVKYYEENPVKGIDIKVIVEPEPMGTAGCLKLAAEHLDDIFLVSNGDSLFDINFLAVLDEFKGSNLVGRMCLREVPNAARFGQVTMNSDGSTISQFKEKSYVNPRKGLINAGVYLFRKEILEFIPKRPSSIESDIFPDLVKKKKLSGKEFSGYFIDIGIPETYTSVQTELQNVFKKPAILFDRDNTLTIDKHGYTHKVEDLEWISGAKESIRYCNDQGFYVFVVTNQAGVAKGKYSEDAIIDFHDEMQKQLRNIGGHIDDLVYCPHHPDGCIETYRKDCNCRKPDCGMLDTLDQRWPIDWQSSVFVGDKQSDVAAAEKFDIRGILFDGKNLLSTVKDNLDD